MASYCLNLQKCYMLTFSFQFQCENGRIILALKFHEWNQSDFSSKFSAISTAAEFVEQWHEEMSSRPDRADKPKNSDSRSPSSHMPSLPPADLLSTSGATKRRHSESKSPTPSPAQPTTSAMCIWSEAPSPSKRCKFIKEGIDEQIERSRRGMFNISCVCQKEDIYNILMVHYIAH